MSGVRRRGWFTAAVAVMGAALIAALFATPPDKPVDIRLVAPPPPSPEVITATATTTVSAIGGVRLPPPPPPPPPPLAGVEPPPRHGQEPPPPPPPPQPPRKPKPKPPTLFDLLRCDSKWISDADFNRCLDWPLGAEEFCDFLAENHLRPVDLRGPNGRRFERYDCD